MPLAADANNNGSRTNDTGPLPLCVPAANASGHTTKRAVEVLLQRPASLVAVARTRELHVSSRSLKVSVQLSDATGRQMRSTGRCPGCHLELSLTRPPPATSAATHSSSVWVEVGQGRCRPSAPFPSSAVSHLGTFTPDGTFCSSPNCTQHSTKLTLSEAQALCEANFGAGCRFISKRTQGSQSSTWTLSLIHI